MNKKAQSELITTVLIILLVLAAVVIVWQVVKSSVSGGANQVNKQSQCIGVSMDVVRAMNGTTNTLIARRGAGSADAKVIGYKIYVNGANMASPTVSLGPLDTNTQNVLLALSDKVYVAPILDGNIVCSPSEEVTVPFS
jgi:flagellin-like protein